MARGANQPQEESENQILKTRPIPYPLPTGGPECTHVSTSDAVRKGAFARLLIIDLKPVFEKDSSRSNPYWGEWAMLSTESPISRVPKPWRS